MEKVIHLCWFGRNPKTKTIENCISSWKTFFPDYEIKEWSEDTFDISCNLYVQQAYTAKKWAFVADYARFWALEKYGGLYFDTDVEVVRPFGDLLELEAFAGFETDKYIAPGLVLYTKEPNHPIIKATREYYDNARFLDDNGERIRMNVCSIFTGILEQYGYQANGQKQICGGMTLFPKDYFCPFDDATGLLNKTENTYSIHWYDKSWMSKGRILRNKVTRLLHRWFGVDVKDRIKGVFYGRKTD